MSTTGDHTDVTDATPELSALVRRGEYVVDPHAVAAAILRRSARARESARLAQMLVAAEREDPAPLVQQ
ncbi:MAG: hypothetical protein IRZ21_00665 [Thermoleophilaceae bacterium]|nr:hypothetical protein [Thermoleophilaceae bacterium]